MFDVVVNADVVGGQPSRSNVRTTDRTHLGGTRLVFLREGHLDAKRCSRLGLASPNVPNFIDHP
jgi:hypothetical protein